MGDPLGSAWAPSITTTVSSVDMLQVTPNVVVI